MKVRMAAAMRTAIERPNSPPMAGIWAYMDIRNNGFIKGTIGSSWISRTPIGPLRTPQPRHDDLVFIWCSNIPIDTFIYTTS